MPPSKKRRNVTVLPANRTMPTQRETKTMSEPTIEDYGGGDYCPRCGEAAHARGYCMRCEVEWAVRPSGAYFRPDGSLLRDGNGDPVRKGVVYEGTSRGLTFRCRPKVASAHVVPDPVGEFSEQYALLLYRWAWEKAHPITEHEHNID
ncbi:hypothetical protein [Salisaeta icosahedral phage 1]|uniref:hypothetical protein n=1 Tax=Salisaeta icosahedral phage 1 TaxID=1183239 RepID=UPI00025EA915|nr:hypothetical protein A322_gp08 [Salisaeta icosahedral phage 1]AFJ21463.1 hypothetical protein [Salisaeta icosahedral phage 1]